MSIDPRRGEFPVPGKTYRMTSVDQEFGMVDVEYVRVERVNQSPTEAVVLPNLIGTLRFSSTTSTWWPTPRGVVYHRPLRGATAGLGLKDASYPSGFLWWREFEPVPPISAPAGGGLL